MEEKKEEKKPLVVPEQAGLKKVLAAAAHTVAGRDLLAYLARRCGQFRTSLTRISNGAIEPLSTEAKEAQRLVWLEIRDLLPPELRYSIEELAERPAGEAPVVKSKEERKN